MKNISFFLTFVFFGLLLVSCRDDENIRIPEFELGANLRIVLDPAHKKISSASDFIAFDMYSANDNLSRVDIYVHYLTQRHLLATYTQADFADGVEHLEFDGSDLASWFGVPGFADASQPADFSIRPVVTLTDGRVYPDYVHVSSTDSILNLSGSVQSSANGAFTFRAPFSIVCPSLNLSGEFDVVTTGQAVWGPNPCNSVFTGKVRWTVETPGIYQVQTLINGAWLYDMSMGGYNACYGGVDEAGYPNGLGGIGGTLRMKENCSKLSIIGTSQWSETYTINNLTVNGNQLTIDWSNSYGESAVTVLTRTDGANWPTNLTF